MKLTARIYAGRRVHSWFVHRRDAETEAECEDEEDGVDKTVSCSRRRESKVRAEALDIVDAQLPMVEEVVEHEKRYYMQEI